MKQMETQQILNFYQYHEPKDRKPFLYDSIFYLCPLRGIFAEFMNAIADVDSADFQARIRRDY